MKVVEGQLQLWSMVSDMSRVSDSLASQTMRQFISLQVEQQAMTPDVLPSRVDIRNTIEATTGKLVSSIG